MSDLTVRGIRIENLETQVADLEADLRLSREQTEYANDAMMAMCRRAEKAEAELAERNAT